MNVFVIIVDNPTTILQQNITYDGFIYSWPVINLIKIDFSSGGKDWEVFIQSHSYFSNSLCFQSSKQSEQTFQHLYLPCLELCMKHQLYLELWAFLFQWDTFEKLFKEFFPTLCKKEVVSHPVTVWIWGNFPHHCVKKKLCHTL